jgi:hypothetical protein
VDPAEIKRVEQSNPILQVAVELGLKIRGNVGACFRSERHPETERATLYLDVARNRFFCTSCPDVGGGVIDLVCQLRGWEREKAIEWLAHRVEFDKKTRQLYYGKGKKKG